MLCQLAAVAGVADVSTPGDQALHFWCHCWLQHLTQSRPDVYGPEWHCDNLAPVQRGIQQQLSAARLCRRSAAAFCWDLVCCGAAVWCLEA
jgi:hypothetical protein